MSRTKNISEFAIYTALAFIFSYIESLVPLPLPFPGMKLGLANLVILIILYRKNFRYAFCLSMLRNLLNAFTFGSLFSLAYSLAGSIFSLLVMALFKRVAKKHLSLVSVSAVGGLFHNLGQLVIASLIVGFHSILWYIPILYFSGVLTGVLIGFFAIQILKRFPKS